jgi:uncharacterized protein YndB with AHSA1/START domain
MADIFQDLTVRAPVLPVYEAVATPAGLDCWWSKAALGETKVGAEWSLFFGPEHDWRARVSIYAPNTAFELQMTRADPDWQDTRIGFALQPNGESKTNVRFHHTGWPVGNEHWRISCYCWAAYLRLMRRYVEHGETVPYESRLDA